MKHACLALLLVLLPLCQAATRFEFSVWMRDIDQRSVSVQRHLQANRLQAARADARELERLYGLMEQYFAKDYPAEHAVTVSREGRLHAAAISEQLDGADLLAAAQSARAIALACNDCHDDYKPFP